METTSIAILKKKLLSGVHLEKKDIELIKRNLMYFRNIKFRRKDNADFKKNEGGY